MAEVKQIYDLLFTFVITIVAIAGALYGGYQLFDGFTNDQPAEKKRGFTVLIVTVAVIIFLIALKPIIASMAGI